MNVGVCIDHLVSTCEAWTEGARGVKGAAINILYVSEASVNIRKYLSGSPGPDDHGCNNDMLQHKKS